MRRAIAWGALVGSTTLGCATVRHEVELAQDLVVKVAEGTPIPKKRGEVFEAGAEPVLFDAPGHVGVLMIPAPRDPSRIRVALRPIESTAAVEGALASRDQEEKRRKQDPILNELLQGVERVHTLLVLQRAGDAVTLVEQLEQRFPAAGYLRFLRASCLVVAGRREEGRAALEQAMQDFPDNEAGRRLLAALGGRGFGAGLAPAGGATLPSIPAEPEKPMEPKP